MNVILVQMIKNLVTHKLIRNYRVKKEAKPTYLFNRTSRNKSQEKISENSGILQQSIILEGF